MADCLAMELITKRSQITPLQSGRSFCVPKYPPMVNSVNINQQYQLPAEVQRLQTWQPHELGYGTRPYGCTTFGGIAPSRSQWVLYSYPKVSQKAGALDDLFL